MEKKSYYENIVEEIVELIKTNILLYYRNLDDTFLGIKKYCLEKEEDEKYQKLDYMWLLHFTEEALAELINCEFLYDFRALE